MHKIKKGIKKKIKGKKHKDEELFTEEELENYKKRKEEEDSKRCLEENQEEEVEEPPIGLPEKDQLVPSESPAEPNTEETPKEDWKNFFATTDTVLKKTSENLEHIKEVSYFQSKKAEEVVETKEATLISAPSDSGTTQKKHWVDLDKGGIEESDEEEERKEEAKAQVEQVEEEPVPERKEEKHIELKPIEDLPSVDVEDYADIFDTTYVDNVESGEVKLHYIPDSPTDREANEPDPFDTSVVNKILHIEEPPKVENTKEPAKAIKKKNLVNLGSAVKVLTGDGTPESSSIDKTDSEVKEVDLLADFEENEGDSSDLAGEAKPETAEAAVNETCLVDDILFGEKDEEGNLPDVVSPLQIASISEQPSKEEEQSKCTPEHSNAKQEENEVDLSELLDPLSTKDQKVEGESHLKDLVSEFDVINNEEVKEKTEVKLNAIDDNIEDEFDAEFAVLAAESLAKEKEKQIDEIGVLDDDDPFDTSSVKKVLGETEELERKPEQVEEDPFDVSFAKNVLGENADDQEDHTKKDIETVDPFDTSIVAEVIPTDLFELEGEVNLPDTLKPDAEHLVPKLSEEFDPFDTSAAASFGKTELRVLEGELLDDISKEVDDDFDFNPREEEQLNLEQQDPSQPACLLSSSPGGSEAPVLAPVVKSSPTEEIDPFDTSFAEKVQIQNLEEEFLTPSEKQASVSVEGASKKVPPRPPGPSILPNHSKTVNSIALLPEEIDPFDTSIADKFEVPQENSQGEGEDKSKLKLELKPPRPPSPACLLATTPVDQNPTLEPTARDSATHISSGQDDFDPFDTSIAEQFGKTELKVLETELLTAPVAAPVQITQSEDDFDPREGEVIQKPTKPIRPPSPACLLTGSHLEDDQQVPVLAPLDIINTADTDNIDPFDTSIAEKFGKSELENLESELLSNIPEKPISLALNLCEKEIPSKPLRPPSPSVCVFATTPTDTNPALQPSAFVENLKENTPSEDLDPFDTSIADQFGKTELKALEESLFLEESEKKLPISNPILDTTKVSRPPITTEADQPDNSNPDKILCLSPSIEEVPVLQPSVNSVDIDPITDEIDPFDTSIADKFGKTELRALESELVDSGLKRSLSDDEFDPRGEEVKSTKKN